MIKIFDTLAHPTIDSNWTNEKYKGLAGFDALISSMNENKIKKAIAVGMKNIGNYEEKKYIETVKKYKDKLLPVAFFDLFDFSHQDELANYLKYLKKLGYIGIKIHPRFSNINLTNNQLENIVKTANDLSLNVFLCTYFSDKKLGLRNNLQELMQLLSRIENEKIVLLHSGGIYALELINMAYVFKNVLFDLSFTICKYEESSVDLDIKYLFKNFDRRICIGTDFPEITHKKLRERFEYFSKGISIEKAQNIAYKNIEKHVGGV